jgi:hypothetical protein
VVGALPCRQAEQRRPDHDAGLIPRHMGELQPARCIADGMDPPVGGAQAGIDRDALWAGLDARLGKPQRLGLHPPARRDQQMGAGDGAAVGQMHGHPRAARDPCRSGLFADRDALGAQRGEHHGRRLGVVAAQRAVGLDHGDRAAKPSVRLRHLDPDRAAAQHDQMLRPGAQIEDRLVGQIGHGLDPRHRRDRRARTGGKDESARPDAGAAGRDLARRDKARRRPDHLHAQPLESLLAVMRRDGGDGRGDMVLGRGKIDLRDCRRHAKAPAGGHRMGMLGRCQQRLRGDAAGVEAIAPHRAGLDQHNPRAKLCRAGRHRQPARPGADHAQIGGDRGRHVPPPRPRQTRTTIGRAASAARPSIGPSTKGSKMMPRSGVAPRANTSPRPAPTQV